MSRLRYQRLMHSLLSTFNARIITIYFLSIIYSCYYMQILPVNSAVFVYTGKAIFSLLQESAFCRFDSKKKILLSWIEIQFTCYSDNSASIYLRNLKSFTAGVVEKFHYPFFAKNFPLKSPFSISSGNKKNALPVYFQKCKYRRKFLTSLRIFVIAAAAHHLL